MSYKEAKEKYLRADILNHQVRFFQYDSEYKLNVLGVSFKTLGQKIIVQQTKTSEPL